MAFFWNRIGIDTSMKRVSLQFETIEQLSEYAEVINIDKCKTDRRKRTIRGELSDADIELAVLDYGGVVLQEMQVD
ncbi:MAG: hypothetical protein JWP27_498 [Flaviaesturariibacter sp.]|nr:hypothetical protein [Flaviaesturariibacter sp.]